MPRTGPDTGKTELLECWWMREGSEQRVRRPRKNEVVPADPESYLELLREKQHAVRHVGHGSVCINRKMLRVCKYSGRTALNLWMGRGTEVEKDEKALFVWGGTAWHLKIVRMYL